MTRRTLRAHFDQGAAAVSAWLVDPSPVVAELVSREGFDCVAIDLQHSAVGADAAMAMMQAMSATAVPPVVRVPWNEPGIIMRMLDAGAQAIICPMINGAEECSAFVRACQYVPRGYRSWGPHRATLVTEDDYFEFAGENVLAFAMIETVQALKALPEILAVEGLAGVFVGPSDLSATMGLRPAPDWTDGPVLDAIKEILVQVTAAGLIPGIATNSAAYAGRMLDLGYRLVTVPSELTLMIEGMRATLAHLGRN